MQRAYASDPFCDSVASLRLLGDMLLGGISLVESGYATWPNKLPLLVIHGSGDKVRAGCYERLAAWLTRYCRVGTVQVTEYESSEGFAQKIKTKGADATFYGYEGFYVSLFSVSRACDTPLRLATAARDAQRAWR